MQFKPLPLLSAGGYQPYSQAGGQLPGPALQAMQRGAPMYMLNPMDQRRQMMQLANRRVTLLDLLRGQ